MLVLVLVANWKAMQALVITIKNHKKMTVSAEENNYDISPIKILNKDDQNRRTQTYSKVKKSTYPS